MTPRTARIQCTVSRMYSKEERIKSGRKGLICCGREEAFDKYETREISVERESKTEVYPKIDFSMSKEMNWF